MHFEFASGPSREELQWEYSQLGLSDMEAKGIACSCVR